MREKQVREKNEVKRKGGGEVGKEIRKNQTVHSY